MTGINLFQPGLVTIQSVQVYTLMKPSNTRNPFTHFHWGKKKKKDPVNYVSTDNTLIASCFPLKPHRWCRQWLLLLPTGERCLCQCLGMPQSQGKLFLPTMQPWPQGRSRSTVTSTGLWMNRQDIIRSRLPTTRYDNHWDLISSDQGDTKEPTYD